MQNKIDFIIAKAGGDSLAHVFAALAKGQNYRVDVGSGDVAIFLDPRNPIYWDFFIGKSKQEAKLQHQSPETQLAIAKLLRSEEND